MSQSLFRRSAARAAEHRWFSPVLVITPPSTLPTVLLSLLAISSFMLATVVIEIPERVRASGVLLPSQGLLKVRARRSGWVERLSVVNGARVTRGQVLLWLTDDQHAPQRQPEATERIISLQNELAMLEQSTEHEIAAMVVRKSFHQQRLQLIEDRLHAARAEYATRLQQAEVQTGRATRVGQLAAAGQLALQRADDVAAEALQARALGQTVWQRVLALQDELMLLEAQAAQDADAPVLLRAQAQMRREALLRDIAASELRSALELTSPSDGIVAGLAVRAGSFVQSGQLIMTLHDPADRLEARLFVSADNAAMITTGQRVELQLRAYPHQLFGTQSAVITSVSAVALPAAEIDFAIPQTGLVFEIRAALESTNVAARGSVWQLPPGTVFSADLLRRRWPLYRWLLRSKVAGPNA